MDVIKSNNFDNINIGPVVMALGTFDGVHLGHQAVIEKAKEKAKKLTLPVAIYTFCPHPLKVLKPAVAPHSIISNRQKIEIMSNMKLDYYLQQKFTPDFAAMEYDDFIENYLINRFSTKHLVVGEDFKLGRKGKGDVINLQKKGNTYGFSVTGLKNVMIENQRVSSTLIREMISNGKISKIPFYLGRYYQLNGKVIKGDGRGKKLGVPTANLKLSTDYVLPPSGVYACFVNYRGKKYKGIANFGNNPTFGGKSYSIEVHIFDFDKENIYGKKLTITLVDFVREEMTFSSSEDLVKQIKKDILYTDSLLCYN